SRRRHTRFSRVWSSDVCSSDLGEGEDQCGTPTPLVAESLPVLREQVGTARRRYGPAEQQAEIVFTGERGGLVTRGEPHGLGAARSEERRVGKEGRARR